MERIEALLRKLKEQFDLKTDPNVMLGTVQLLEFELTKLRSGASQSLGTAKVSVILPSTNTVSSQYEKYAPRPLEKNSTDVKEPVQEVKETILVDDGSLSVVQKNGQLNWVFDPMTEIPTLSHQSTEKDINDTTKQGESINDKLRQGKTELVEILKESPVKDLRKAIGINDRFLFINDLFRGDEVMYERSIKTINSFNIYAEAEYWINRELKVKLGWPTEHPSVDHFDQLVKRRFS